MMTIWLKCCSVSSRYIVPVAVPPINMLWYEIDKGRLNVCACEPVYEDESSKMILSEREEIEQWKEQK